MRFFVAAEAERREKMPKKNKLSVYLIKDEFADDDSKIVKETKNVLGVIENVGVVYYAPSVSVVPKWIDSFYRGEIPRTGIFTSNARVALITRVNIEDDIVKTFAITMGYGKYLLENDVVENDFGIKVVLNSISHDSLRKINKVNIGGNQKASSEQLPLASAIDEFGFDIESDLISAITGYCDDEKITEGMMSGSELLSLNANVDITNIKIFLKRVYKKYCSKQYRENFAWIDHIQKVRDSKIVEKLESEVVKLIKEKSPDVWMAVPDVLDWENVKGFKYSDKGLEEDIYISKVVESFKKGFYTFEQLRSKTISAISAQDGMSNYVSWKAYKCLYGEVELDGKAYCINNGQWYCVDKDFVRLVNDEYDTIPISKMEFIEYEESYSTENAYSKAFVGTKPDYMLCMDKKNIHHGGGHSQIELCDVLTTDNTYIHIKPYSGSSTLSHLFNQAVVSAELVVTDKAFIKKANDKIKETTGNMDFLICEGDHPHVILGIISKYDAERPRIPFFSKVALRYAQRRLKGYNCELELKNIKKK